MVVEIDKITNKFSVMQFGLSCANLDDPSIPVSRILIYLGTYLIP